MDYIKQLIERYPALSGIKEDIFKAGDILIEMYRTGGKLLAAGNGGSAADAEHIIGELMKSFVKKRRAPAEFIDTLHTITDSEKALYLGEYLAQGIPGIALTAHTALNTACINDIDGTIIYAQQVYGYGKAEDVFLGISTSGNSKNILYAMITAKAKKMKTIALTGGSGGAVKQYADIAIIVPETETYKIQELHLPIYHALCLMLEDYFF
ncbi:MAG: SIS domain-containing protein [Treponema sp.]|jgi:D-sedoheptulose 7-phosphate isomerase|nr:SIS domain-containing protein [Treponema sp.]